MALPIAALTHFNEDIEYSTDYISLHYIRVKNAEALQSLYNTLKSTVKILSYGKDAKNK